VTPLFAALFVNAPANLLGARGTDAALGLVELNAAAQPSLVLGDADPRRGHFDPHSVEAAQEGNERFGVVSGEDPTDLQLP
jgi:hypothetical protein